MTEKGYVRCKYLDDLGLDITEYGTNFIDNTDERWDKWTEEREKYGFDSRETWNLDTMFVEWIYTRFKMYEEITTAELKNYSFEYKDNFITQEEAIDIILKACIEYLQTPFEDRVFLSSEIIKLIGDILPAMWW